MNDINVTGRVDGNWDSRNTRVSINAGNGSPLEYAYTLVYLLGLAGGAGLSVSVVMAACVAYVYDGFSFNNDTHVILLFAAFVVMSVVVTLACYGVLMFTMSALMETYGGNHQPRDDGGRFIPVYQQGKLSGRLWTKNRRK